MNGPQDERSFTEPDEVMTRIGEGMTLRDRGEHAAAATVFTHIWDHIGQEAGDPFYRCALAHSMADVQDDVHQELHWDLRALAAADELTDARAAQGGVTGPVAGFYPSLHLNIGDCYRRLGDHTRAREHHRQGTEAVAALASDGYGQMITKGLDKLAERLAQSSRPPT